MKFLDEAKITITSGAGGAGCLSFRREKFIEFGGPDGGNGGNGASIIFVAEPNLTTLIDYRYKQHFKGRKGGHGMGRNRTGKSAEDVLIPVPLGTEITDAASGAVLADLTQAGQSYLALKGGRGGRGNASYTSSTNQSPRETTPGEPGQELEVWLRLKLLADVGLLGLPNAGKSTFISVVSNAKPKIADYPFTTLKPNLGMVRHYTTDMLLADLPGLIEGAHEGTGLGHRFLKHLSRCKILLHLVDIQHEDVGTAYTTIRRELEKYDALYGTQTAQLPEVIALSRCDTADSKHIQTQQTKLAAATGRNVIALCALTRQGVDDILDLLAADVLKARKELTVDDNAAQIDLGE